MENIKKTVDLRMKLLKNSEMRFKDIYEIMFMDKESIMAEYADGYRIKQKTYGEYACEIPKTASAIRELCGTGEYIALAMENSPEWITLFWSILMSGNNVLLINMRLPLEMIKKTLDNVQVKNVISLDKQDYGITCYTAKDIFNFTSSLRLENEWGNEIALFTSGTTLHEKVCVYSGEQIAAQVLNSGAIIKDNYEITRHYKGMLKQLAFLPFYHIYGLTACYMWFAFFGRTFVFLRDYSADTITKTVRKHGVTHIFAVPMLWHIIEKNVLRTLASQDQKVRKKFEKGIKISLRLQNILPDVGQRIARKMFSEVTDRIFGDSIKFCITGGSYIRPSALKLINALGYPLYNGYGMTEIGITSVELRRRPKDRIKGAIGKPFGSVEYKISDNRELMVKGSSIFKGMYYDGKYSDFEDEWLNTGDIAFSDEKGNYFLCGRKSDCVISDDGENLNPDEAERLLSIDYANRYCVLGLDVEGTEQLCLVIEPEVSLTATHSEKMMKSLYEQLKKLPPAYRIKRVFFAQSPIASDMDIKVSRAALRLKIRQDKIKLIDAAEYFKQADSMTKEEQTNELTDAVIDIFAEVLNKKRDEIGKNSHFVFDLEGNSMEYLTLVSELEKEFGVKLSVDESSYCATPAEFSKNISNLIMEDKKV